MATSARSRVEGQQRKFILPEPPAFFHMVCWVFVSVLRVCWQGPDRQGTRTRKWGGQQSRDGVERETCGAAWRTSINIFSLCQWLMAGAAGQGQGHTILLSQRSKTQSSSNLSLQSRCRGTKLTSCAACRFRLLLTQVHWAHTCTVKCSKWLWLCLNRCRKRAVNEFWFVVCHKITWDSFCLVTTQFGW